jgi:hypothetical protein
MGNRKHSLIDDLPPELKWTIEQMLLSGSTYTQIVDYLAQHDVAISIASICRYARQYNANAQMLAIAQENFQRLMDQMDRYPDLDTTEAIIRLASQNVINALANTDEAQWAEMDKEKLMGSALGLVRAASYKKRTDSALKDSSSAGLDAVKEMVFAAMAKERPDLYKEVAAFLKKKKT